MEKVPLVNALRYRVKLAFGKARMRANHYESCFGNYPQKYAELFRWVDRALKLEGDLLEFGVHLGGTTCLLAEKLLESGRAKTIHAFDSFSGFDPREFDMCHGSGAAKDASQKNAFRSRDNSVAYLEMKLKTFGFERCVRLHPGYFQDTLEPFLRESPSRAFCFALIDCDLALSVEFCADRIYDRLTPGGVMLFDDYGSLATGKPDTSFSPGVRKVVDEFVGAWAPASHGYVNGLYHFVK